MAELSPLTQRDKYRFVRIYEDPDEDIELDCDAFVPYFEDFRYVITFADRDGEETTISPAADGAFAADYFNGTQIIPIGISVLKAATTATVMALWYWKTV